MKEATPEVCEEKKEWGFSLLPIESITFDEMNLIEIPFCLLTDSKVNRRSIDLSPNGTEHLTVASDKIHGLPTALAERVVLALMWLTKRQNAFSSPVIEFPLRHLIENYMYPHRDYSPSGVIANRVIEELHRIAATRIYSKRWYDKELNKHIEIDAAIIDYIKIIDQGGKNQTKRLEIRWGDLVYKSMRDNYTKPLNIATYQQIERPLDRRFYRWLDRQLATKSIQVVRSCQNFAQYKLLMTGTKIDCGGRMASTYIVNSLSESLERLSGLGFSVSMEVNRESKDFSICFQKTKASANEVLDASQADLLVRDFHSCVYDIDPQQPRKMLKQDIKTAEDWVARYGMEKASFMVRRCLELHKAAFKGQNRIFSFKGLTLFELAASQDYSKLVVKEKHASIGNIRQQAYEAWNEYEADQIAKADKILTQKKLMELEEKAKAFVEKMQKNLSITGEEVLSKILNGQINSLKLEAVQAMSEKDFIAQLI